MNHKLISFFFCILFFSLELLHTKFHQTVTVSRCDILVRCSIAEYNKQYEIIDYNTKEIDQINIRKNIDEP